MVSAGALAYEILLMRLFSIIHWHHFAYMMISLAMLGYGASGTFLVLARKRLKGHYRCAFIINATAISMPRPRISSEPQRRFRDAISGIFLPNIFTVPTASTMP